MSEYKPGTSFRSAPAAEPHWIKHKGSEARKEAALRQSATRVEEQKQQARRTKLREETKRRRYTEGHSKPLAVLAGREQALEDQSRANAILKEKPPAPDLNLISHQLQQVARGVRGNSGLAEKQRDEFLQLYSDLNSQGPIESIIDRTIVATMASTMDAFGNAAVSSTRTRDMELRHGMRGAQVLMELIWFRDSRQGSRHQTQVVGNRFFETKAQITSEQARQSEHEGFQLPDKSDLKR